MTRREFTAALGWALAVPFAAGAQQRQQGKTRHVEAVNVPLVTFDWHAV
jgi:hypothetical protein